MTGPMVSITVCVRNGAHWIDDCLASLKGQTHPSTEILVVNDGSTDGAEAILDAHHDPRETTGSPSGFTTNPRWGCRLEGSGPLNKPEANG